MMKTDNPVGRTISHEDNTYTIIGVVKDFHFKPLHRYIEPLIFFVIPGNFNILYAKIRTDTAAQTIGRIETVFKKFSPEFPFRYRFLDEAFGRLYRSEKRIGTIFQYFAFLAIFISCLGLFGLASFMAEQRTREIGIRKALGSTVGSIIVLLLKEFVKWVAIANIIAWPTAFVVMSSWLRNFAYRTSIGLDIFILSGLATLAIAVITVSYQSIKTATANPVEALRCE
jgi:putative ABC transport system permease protein